MLMVMATVPVTVMGTMIMMMTVMMVMVMMLPIAAIATLRAKP